MFVQRLLGAWGLALLTVFVAPLAGCSKGDGDGGVVAPPVPVDTRGPVLQALQPVYAGQGVPTAAAYGTQVPRPTVVLGPGGVRDAWSNALPGPWWPNSVAEAELVVCVGPQNEAVVQSCRYNIGPNIVRHRFNRAIVLREARTARIVAKVTLYGSMPDRCPQTAPYSQTREDGSGVAYDQAQAWFAPYVTGSRRSIAALPAVREPASTAGGAATSPAAGHKTLVGSTEALNGAGE